MDTYLLPHIEDSLNTLGGEQYFCSLDLTSGYWQVETQKEDREKTAFFTQGGLYEFKVMLFGSPAPLSGTWREYFGAWSGLNIIK